MPSLAMITDSISELDPKKDTSIAIIEEANHRGWQCHYCQQTDLFLKYGAVWGATQEVSLSLGSSAWVHLGSSQQQPLDQFDVLFMRKDPPVTLEYLYTTQLLEYVEAKGSWVINKPQSLRDINEKLFINWFPQCIAPTLVTAEHEKIVEFIQEHRTVVLKPLHGMGGHGIFKCTASDPNLTVIIETLSKLGNRFVMVQKFIEEISEGDKRIFLIDGVPVSMALARVPREGEFRGNLAVGGQGHAVPLSVRDQWICAQVGPTLREKGLVFVGLDVIGDYLTEINITSPTCVRELQADSGINVAALLLDCIEEKLGD